MKLKQHLPNAITCGNLFCGCVAIVFAYTNNLHWASIVIGLAAVLDFLDGFAARLLKVHSAIGQQLDSLADMVSFGVAPGAIMFMMINNTLNADNHNLVWISFIIPVFSALRLAKFNIDTRQTDSFIGVPTPANTILIASFPLILRFQPTFFYVNIAAVLLNTWFLIGTTIVMSYLLVAELPLFALKFKTFAWGSNKIRYLFLGAALLLLIIFQFIAIPFIILLYVLLSLLNKPKSIQ